MDWYHVEHASVTLLSFLFGMAIGHVIAPESLTVTILAGIIFAAFMQASVARTYGSDWFFPIHRSDPGNRRQASPKTGER